MGTAFIGRTYDRNCNSVKVSEAPGVSRCRAVAPREWTPVISASPLGQDSETKRDRWPSHQVVFWHQPSPITVVAAVVGDGPSSERITMQHTSGSPMATWVNDRLGEGAAADEVRQMLWEHFLKGLTPHLDAFVQEQIGSFLAQDDRRLEAGCLFDLQEEWWRTFTEALRALLMSLVEGEHAVRRSGR
jgi:hypothetical protein